MLPGGSKATTVTLTNTGSASISAFTLTPGTCVQSANGSVSGSATDFCSKLQLQIVSGTTTLFSGTADSFSSSSPISLATPLAAGASQSYTFTVTLASSADNTYQGLKASQPMTWSASS
jgi:hypothetical protein